MEEASDAGPLQHTTIHKLRDAFHQGIGDLGQQTFNLLRRKGTDRPQNYSISLLAAVSPEGIVSNQLIEGPVDASLFAKFIHESLKSLREDPRYQRRPIVLLMDNARIHTPQEVLDAALAMKAIVLFNA